VPASERCAPALLPPTHCSGRGDKDVNTAIKALGMDAKAV
jgi:hypothetical protein